MSGDIPAHIREHIPLADKTTIGLGGTARYFALCDSVETVASALDFVSAQALPTVILAGGSNTIFPDEGYPGVVISVACMGSEWSTDGDDSIVRVGAGEEWDHLVQAAIDRDAAGIECLSGIPGSVGATPIQNVGAYGQEVSQVIDLVEAYDQQEKTVVHFTAGECQFGYRTSRFKEGPDQGRFIITYVTYRLRQGGSATTSYPQVADALADMSDPSLAQVRETVLQLRRGKSMVVDAQDPHSRSCGSFFVNPTVTDASVAQVVQMYRDAGGDGEVPTFVDDASGVRRIPAAWLIEQAGFPKGYRHGGVGVSENHNLALVNYGGTTTQLLDLAARIRAAVEKKFAITLEREPVVV